MKTIRLILGPSRWRSVKHARLNTMWLWVRILNTEYLILGPQRWRSGKHARLILVIVGSYLDSQFLKSFLSSSHFTV